MARPLLYFTVALLQSVFWLVEVLANYADYVEGNPIFLKKAYLELLEANRFQLLVAELLAPAGFVLAFAVLFVLKLRSQGIRYALLLAMFLSTGFWAYRAFVFPDRIVRYFQMSTPDFYMHLSRQDPFVYYFGAHVALMVLVVWVGEYSAPPLDELMGRTRIKERERPWERDGQG